MSNLLKEAIVDANALREAALKHAETKIVDKYSDEVRQTLEALLEQDELGLDLGADPMAADPMAADPAATGEEDTIEEDVEDVPYAATDDLSGMDGENLKNVPGEGENVEVTLDLGSLKEAVQELQKEIDEELTFSEEDFAAVLSEDDASTTSTTKAATGDPEEGAFETQQAGTTGDTGKEGEGGSSAEALEAGASAETADSDATDKITESEDIEISEDLISDLVEKLTVDMGADLSGWAGRPDFQQKEEMEKEMARRRSTEVEEDMKVLKKAQEELVFENKQLTSKLTQYEQVTLELKETLQTVNLSNARLLYTNRVLRNTSLNERQKSRIVEAISKADSVTEAKTIYNTLESTVESAPKRGPKSLSEAIHRPTSVIRATRAESKQTDVFAERMRRLAGIK
tara:strand:+ start:6789 stop:7994 length:1206 start_codon:yes stop_codon:yes gene_type:complete